MRVTMMGVKAQTGIVGEGRSEGRVKYSERGKEREEEESKRAKRKGKRRRGRIGKERKTYEMYRSGKYRYFLNIEVEL